MNENDNHDADQNYVICNFPAVKLCVSNKKSV